jgi:5-bromo-4-chloroindolyl phosphate hydrolysis protein
MEYTAGIFGISFLICVAGVFFYLQSEKNAYKLILNRAETMQVEYSQMKKQIEETNRRIDEYRNLFLTFKRETVDSIDMVQNHCAKIREQQQILNRKQISLKEKMIPNKVELTVVETPKAPTKLIKKIQKQMKDLQ